MHPGEASDISVGQAQASGDCQRCAVLRVGAVNILYKLDTLLCMKSWRLYDLYMTRSRLQGSYPQPLLLLQPCSPLLQQLVLCAAPLLSHLQPASTLEVSCQCMQ